MQSVLEYKKTAREARALPAGLSITYMRDTQHCTFRTIAVTIDP